MMMNATRMRKMVTAMVVVGIGAIPATAATGISGNYCSVAPIVDFPSGVVPLVGWNDLTGPAGFGPTDSITDPLYDDGTTATGTEIFWESSPGASQNTNDYVFRPLPPNTLGNNIDDGHDQMMTGYLQASKFSSFDPFVAIGANNIDLNKFSGTYDLIIYFDGDDDVGNDTNAVEFSLWKDTTDHLLGKTALASYYGRDTTSSNFAIDHTVAGSLADYVQITSTVEASPTEGNYVVFEDLDMTSFYMRATGVANAHGVAINGFQIVPEPTSLFLLGLGSIFLLGRRRCC